MGTKIGSIQVPYGSMDPTRGQCGHADRDETHMGILSFSPYLQRNCIDVGFQRAFRANSWDRCGVLGPIWEYGYPIWVPCGLSGRGSERLILIEG